MRIALDAENSEFTLEITDKQQDGIAELAGDSVFTRNRQRRPLNGAELCNQDA